MFLHRDQDPFNVPLTLGRMRCLRALGDWERLAGLSRDLWQREEGDMEIRGQIAPLGAAAAWNLGEYVN